MTPLPPLTQAQQIRIRNNVIKACQDITKLNKQGYNFLYLASGFIAHYNLYGFIDYYKHHSLKADILANYSNNQWNNFRPNETDYDYYMTKKNTYNLICHALMVYKVNV